ncbi:hypothetical protein SAMN05421874_12869 [Nonomuraea maritima]|uniref:Uncharacterized protein n=1 Tax=Nonomuraea maritima TaxID=683260 RepID=A0A1G9MK38_9ACTN|nr:hypothetical protein [Nonomuraea maritima]SDL74494.1 hypothetical protein SAMN05421874_12869 [Nonomuraea maritima]
MLTPADALDVKRKRNRSRNKKAIPRNTAIWSSDGATLLAVVEGHVTPDDIAAARQLALRATASQ